MTARSDEQLVQALARRDMAALDVLVRRHQAFVWAVAYRFLGDRAAAEDVAQQTFLRLLRAAHRYRPAASLRSYLFRIASRLSLDVHRRDRRLAPDVAAPERADRGPDPAQALSARDEASQVHQAIASLPPRQRTAIIGRFFEEMSYAEIAASMKISTKAVERLLGRARRALAAELRLERKTG